MKELMNSFIIFNFTNLGVLIFVCFLDIKDLRYENMICPTGIVIHTYKQSNNWDKLLLMDDEKN